MRATSLLTCWTSSSESWRIKSALAWSPRTTSRMAALRTPGRISSEAFSTLAIMGVGYRSVGVLLRHLLANPLTQHVRACGGVLLAVFLDLLDQHVGLLRGDLG